MDDGSLANLEIQKIGYAFPGQRMACYAADMLLRQYKRVRSRRKKNFTYKDIKKVYVLVLFERSTGEFHNFPEKYIHRSRQIFDTGLKIDLLEEFILIPLDIFKETHQNKNILKIDSELDAWLAFLTFDEPQKILELLQAYPAFEEMYKEIYDLCRNVEGVMDMFFSKELLELDRNTVQYMIEEQEKQLQENREEIRKNKEELQKSKEKIWQNKQELQQSQQELQERNALILQMQQEIHALKQQLEALKK